MRRHLLLLAPAGMLLGHTVGYLAVPPQENHAEVAAAHAHVPAIAVMAVGVALAALVVSAVRHGAAAGRGRLFALSAAQVAAYCGMEVLERVATGLDAGAALGEPAILAGLAAQLAVAALLLGVDRGARRAGRLVAEALRPRQALSAAHTPRPAGPATTRIPVCRVTWRACQQRAPPALLVAR